MPTLRQVLIAARKWPCVGGGPAGITAALMLREAGCAVTIFDRNEKSCGVLRYGIPEFRLDPKLVEQYDRIMAEAGVEFKGGVNVTASGEKGSVSLSSVMKDYDAVLMTAGASIPRKLDVPGEDSDRIIYALDYLKDPGCIQTRTQGSRHRRRQCYHGCMPHSSAPRS